MKKVFFSIGLVFLACFSGCSGDTLQEEKNSKELEQAKKELKNMEKAYEMIREKNKDLENQIDNLEEAKSKNNIKNIPHKEMQLDDSKGGEAIVESEFSFGKIEYKLYNKKVSDVPDEYGNFTYERWITKQEKEGNEVDFFDIPHGIKGNIFLLSGISPSGNILYIETWWGRPGNLLGLETESKEILWKKENIRAESEVLWSPDKKQAAFISGGFFDTFPDVGITKYENVKKIDWILKTDLNFVRDGDDTQFFYWKDNETFVVNIPKNYFDDLELKKAGLQIGENEFTTR